MLKGFWKLTWVETKVFIREPMGLIGTLIIPVVLRDVERRENLIHQYHQAPKHGTHPVLRQEAPWERHPGMTASVVYDEEEGIFKAWYMAGFYAPSEAHVQCLALSEDGIHWERPALGLHEALGSTASDHFFFPFLPFSTRRRVWSCCTASWILANSRLLSSSQTSRLEPASAMGMASRG